MDVMSELARIDQFFTSRDLDTGSKELWKLWDAIPDPKIDTPNAYLVIEYGVAFALKGGALNEAQKWVAFAPPFAEIRHDMGEVEFLIGKVAFARSEYDVAKENFLIANVKSEGRAFEDEDRKYRQLIGLR